MSEHIALTTSDTTRDTYFQTDGAKTRFGFILYQTKKLYSPIDLECLSMHFALSKTNYWSEDVQY